MRAVKVNGIIMVFPDNDIPEEYVDASVEYAPPPMPKDGCYRLDLILGNLVWVPREPTMDEKLHAIREENKRLRAQVKAQTERADFVDDCIAEMATVVYNA